jgi:uncharacterized membrane protein YgcG
MKKKILWIITAVLLVLSLQGCYVGIDPGWGGHGGYGHGGGGGHHGNGGHGGGGGHHR